MTPADKELLLTLIAERHELYGERFANQEKAVRVAETNSEKWRDNANEWRAAMNDREAKFTTQAEVDANLKAVNERLNALEAYKLKTEGKGAGLSFGGSAILSVVGFILTVLLIANVVVNFTK